MEGVHPCCFAGKEGAHQCFVEKVVSHRPCFERVVVHQVLGEVVLASTEVEVFHQYLVADLVAGLAASLVEGEVVLLNLEEEVSHHQALE